MACTQNGGFRCKHPDCIYRAKDSDSHYKPWGCNYSDIEGITRHKAYGKSCPPEICPFYKSGKRIRNRTNPFTVTPQRVKPVEEKKKKKDPVRIERGPHYDWEEARRLWIQGKSDAEVSAVLGCSISYAGKVRRRMGFDSLTMREADKKAIPSHKLKEMNAAGLNDSQIAQLSGVSSVYVQRRRAALHLLPNYNTITDPEQAREVYNKIMKGESNGQA